MTRPRIRTSSRIVSGRNCQIPPPPSRRTPWGVSPRQLNYSHYLFEAIPYACLSLGTILDLHWDAADWRRLAARAYLALVVVMYFFFLPFLLALPVPTSWYYFDIMGWRPWTWFSTWV